MTWRIDGNPLLVQYAGRAGIPGRAAINANLASSNRKDVEQKMGDRKICSFIPSISGSNPI